jgi:DNA modification methylase
MNIRDRIKELRRVRAGDLRPHPKNWRKHPEEQANALRGILAEIGYVDALMVRELPDGALQIVDGHLRAETTPDAEVPVLVVDLDDKEAEKVLATFDPLGAMAEPDEEQLAALLKGIETDSEALAALLEQLADDAAKGRAVDVVEDDIPAPPDAATTKLGDLIILGEHRLLCGDSSKPEDVDRLLDGAVIHLVNSDPPYNVKVEPRSNNAIAAGLSSFTNSHHQGMDLARHPEKAKPTQKKLRAKDRPLANDFVSDDEFDRLLAAWFGNMARVLAPGRGFYIWGGYANCANYPPVLKACGLYFSQAVIWHKQHPVLTRKDFMGDHEWCQPPDTCVLTASGTSSLHALRDRDRVVSFYDHSSAVVGLRDGLEVQVGHREYSGQLYGVTAAGRQSWSSDGHLWTVRLCRDYGRKWCVYLMRRGSWWRVGVTKMRTTWGFGVKGRLCSELGDEAWILNLHDSHADARIYEQLVSIQFGIPQTCWKEDLDLQRRQRSHIEDLYSRLDLARLAQNAEAALLAHNRSLAYPIVRRDDTRAKFGARQSIQVRACNLLPELMEIPVPTGGQRIQWQPLQAVDVQPYSGPVYSLGVDKHQHYIADGLVTHNCFYGWKEGAGHKFFGPNNVPDVWSVKKLHSSKMVHLTEKPVELAARAMQYSSRAGENVLDLFGGSGSTLMAAEQTGRKAFLMELDPLYADVIVERFEKFTGKKAQRIPATEAAAC